MTEREMKMEMERLGNRMKDIIRPFMWYVTLRFGMPWKLVKRNTARIALDHVGSILRLEGRGYIINVCMDKTLELIWRDKGKTRTEQYAFGEEWGKIHKMREELISIMHHMRTLESYKWERVPYYATKTTCD